MKSYKIAAAFFNPFTRKYMQPGEIIEVDGEQEMTLLLAGVIGEEVKTDANDTGKGEGTVGDKQHEPGPTATSGKQRSK